MQHLHKVLALSLIVSIAACSSMPSDLISEDRLNRQVVFTVSDSRSIPALASGYSDTSTTSDTSPAIDSEMLIAGILKQHKLTKIGEERITALKLKAVIAEFSRSRNRQDVLNALARDTRVESVQTVSKYRLLAYNDPYLQFQSSEKNEDFEVVHGLATGKDVVIGVIDTGVDRLHPELANNIVYGKSFVDHDQSNFDFDEHGTAVAGVIASAVNNDLGIVGVAPDVKIMVFKSCWQDMRTRKATCDSYSIVKALIEVLKLQPDILNLSLSGPRDSLIERLLLKVIDQGIIVIAAIDSQNMSDSFPASMNAVIAVGTPLFEGTMPVNSVLAPGVDILTTAPGATYVFRSGSSLASAYVAGAAALIKERQPNISVVELRERLLSSARYSFHDKPIVSVCAAVSFEEDGEICPRSAMVYTDQQNTTTDYRTD